MNEHFRTFAGHYSLIHGSISKPLPAKTLVMLQLKAGTFAERIDP